MASRSERQATSVTTVNASSAERQFSQRAYLCSVDGQGAPGDDHHSMKPGEYGLGLRCHLRRYGDCEYAARDGDSHECRVRGGSV